MKCEKARRRLSAFLDGEINEKEGKEIRGHLGVCPSCSKELEALSFSWNFLLKLKLVEPPVHLIQRIITKVATIKKELPWWQELFLRPATAMFIIIVGLMIGSILWQFLYLNNNYPGETSYEFASSIYLDSFANFSEGSAGKVIFVEEEG
ncbi:zf-HC2 domain-containing protein [bacterium]|nr:zf-HC2 domain-containing protein [bacterium]MBU1153568.1 zf-HC2 domain-containing protein [bacterium]MBU1782844.1 zf-HC2 domain-containing protein [bacterium]